jgi:hypothetical protein
MEASFMTKVFVIQFHVNPMENSILPAGLGGAYVSCYSQGDRYIEATEYALINIAIIWTLPGRNSSANT